jgi:hypothetical protein
VEKVPAFLADVWAAFTYWMPAGMAFFDTLHHGRRWVIVNAWATFDLRSDVTFWYGPYRNNPAHPVHGAVKGLVNYPSDMIFAAGNCGQFCPDDRCGPADIGHGNSISGANGYQEVLSVGAVRADGLALGYSSQGPGRIKWSGSTSAEKPDVVAPSQYRLETDPGRISSGTSAACGLAAGVVAALRTRPGTVGTNASPADLITALRTSAGGTYDLQFGCGMLNAQQAGKALGII